MNGLQRIIGKLGTTRAFAGVGQALTQVDERLLRRTNGRFGIGTSIGLRTLLLTSIGRRSGQPRQVPLLYVERDGSFIVIGSNWGGENHPAWSANLIDQPEATATVRGKIVPVRAQLLLGDERQAMWDEVAAYWPAYNTYATRAPNREIRVFRLEPVS
ncbi:nitroreductase family deazaflavin-dependent oxidoreductase [Kribbella antibiotica]|uniref:Nitroreductase family deazaflavin-dependent oxidoreductase n=1 Tax=Kribbella antibiotica TaxID=190195 RepID=A0A4R4ZHK3_9ACTN|nr:nitroreductase family deazaflavin-dependent oxidoreductase [Kribbella antibiotica]TDD57905.1 nitroreductase family deazaflavin-dependent oxidoreductase [Kribbella antibiotica]